MNSNLAKLLAPNVTLLTLFVIFLSFGTLTIPAHAKSHGKPGKTYVVHHKTVWGADQLITITPTLMQLDADHLGFKIQYSVANQMIYVWNDGRKLYLETPVDTWLKSFSNFGVILNWSSELRTPSKIVTIQDHGFKSNLYIFNKVNRAKTFFSSDIGTQAQPPLATAHIKTIELDVDPKIGPILLKLNGLPNLKGIPTESYLFDKSPRASLYGLQTKEIEIDPKITALTQFKPPKNYKRVREHALIMSPQGSDIQNVF